METADAIRKFGDVAKRYCEAIDRAQSLDRSEFLRSVYSLLPELILEGTRLPVIRYDDSESKDSEEEARHELLEANAEMSNETWWQLFQSLEEKLGVWDHYHFVFDPLSDSKAIDGSLADDLADIYRDLKDGLALSCAKDYPARDVAFEWRLGFESHWGRHATNALCIIRALSPQLNE